MEQNIWLWLKSLYDLLIIKDEWKLFPLTTNNEHDECPNEKCYQELMNNQSTESQLSQQLNQQLKQDIDINNNNNSNNSNNNDNDKIHSLSTTITNDATNEATITKIVNHFNHNNDNNDNNDCDNNKIESRINFNKNSNKESFNLFWSKFCSKPHSLQSNQFIQIMIDAYCNNKNVNCDPLIIQYNHDYSFNPFVTIRTRQYRIYGLNNVTKTSEDGYIKFMGNHKFSANFIIIIHDVKIQYDCQLKIGRRWHRKRDKLYEMNLTKSRLYIELIIDTDEQTIRLERLMPISQEYSHPTIDHHHHHYHNNKRIHSFRKKIRKSSSCSTINNQPQTSPTTCHFPFVNHLFYRTFIERNIKNHLTNNINHLETIVTKNNGRKCSDSILNYHNLIVETSLYKILNLFPSLPTSSSSSSSSPTTSTSSSSSSS